MQAILDLTLKDLECCLKAKDFSGFAGKQIFSWIYKKAIYDFNQMTNLSKGLRNFLKHNFYISSLVLVKKQASADKTQKFLFGLSDKQAIESVLIPTPRRLTACISTQAGCRFACRICASGAEGWRRVSRSGRAKEPESFVPDADPFGASGAGVDGYEPHSGSRLYGWSYFGGEDVSWHEPREDWKREVMYQRVAVEKAPLPDAADDETLVVREKEIPLAASKGESAEIAVPDSRRLEVALKRADAVDPYRTPRPARRLWAVPRRLLCEARDRLAPVLKR